MCDCKSLSVLTPGASCAGGTYSLLFESSAVRLEEALELTHDCMELGLQVPVL